MVLEVVCGVERSWIIVAGIMLLLVIIVGVGYYFTGPPPSAVTTPSSISTQATPIDTPMPSPTPTPTETIVLHTQVPDKIIIGFTMPLSGRLANEGKSGLLGILTAVKWANEIYGGVRIGDKRVPIEIKYYDDETRRDPLVSLYERLIAVDKVDFLLGPMGTPQAFVAAPVAERYHMVFVN